MNTTPPRPPIRAMTLWLALLSCSLPAAWLLNRAGLPAAVLIAALLCSVAFSLGGLPLYMPRRLFQCAQALIGCTVAGSITSAIVSTVGGNWRVILLAVAATVLAGGLVGWTLVRTRILPGTTAAWGSTPGAASAMVAMAEAFGGDARLVALMQYLRLLVVVLSASLVAHFVFGAGPATPLPASPAPAGAGAVIWPQVFITLAVALTGGLGVWLRIPAGAMLVPMLFGSLLHARDLATLYQPFALQAIAPLLLGWYVGLGFNRRLLIDAFRLLPRLLLSSLLLIGLCAILAGALVTLAHIDPLTAYLATSPGGLDSIILIAIGTQADIPFVVAVQTLRLFTVILLGPLIARLICRYG